MNLDFAPFHTLISRLFSKLINWDLIASEQKIAINALDLVS